MRNSIYISLCLIILSSCEHYHCQPMDKEELVSSIEEYDSLINAKYGSNLNYVLTLSIEDVNDSITRYSFHYDLGSIYWEDSLLAFTSVNGKDILILDKRASRDRVTGISKETHMKLLKKHFPEEYKILTSGKILFRRWTNDSSPLDLLYYKDRLVCKTLRYNEAGEFYKIGDKYFPEDWYEEDSI